MRETRKLGLEHGTVSADPGPFYAGLTPLYHLIYPNWERSMDRQATMLDAVLRERWPDGVSTVLDVSCGIGTQAIGLAKLGYRVTASDLSPEAVERGREEASARDISIDWSVGDMRAASQHHTSSFDLVLSCDNSVPHLLTDADILLAFREMLRCLRPGGGCVVSVRDYEKEDFSGPALLPYGDREADGVRWALYQYREPRGPTYDLTLYVVEENGSSDCRTFAFRSTYYAVGIAKLMELMGEAGFEDVERVDDRYFQPLLIGSAPGA